jgi:WD40 repeat protein
MAGVGFGRAAVLLAMVGLLVSRPAPAQADPLGRGQKTEARVDAQGDPLPPLALARLGTLRLRCPEQILAATMSSDGKLLVSTSNRIALDIHDVATGKLLRTIKMGYINGDPLSLSPDNKTIAALSGTSELLLFDADSGKPLQKFKPAPQQRFSGLAFSRDGKVVGGSAECIGGVGSVLVCDAASGKELGKFDVLQNYRVMLALSGDGKLVATWGHYLPATKDPPTHFPSEFAQIWDVPAGKELVRVKLPQGNVVGAALSPDGKLLATTNGGSTIVVWEVPGGKEVVRLTGQRGLGAVISFSPDGKTLAAATDAGVTFLWDATTWKRLGINQQAWGQRVNGVVFPTQGPPLGWSFLGHALRVWELPGGKAVTPADGHMHRIGSLVFTDKGKKLWSSSLDGRLCQWDVASGKLLKQMANLEQMQQNHGSYVPLRQYWTTILSGDAKFLAMDVPYNNLVRVWERDSKKILCDLEWPRNEPNAMAFAQDGNLVAVGGREGLVKVWNVEKGRELFQLKLQEGEVRKLAFAPDAKTLAIGFAYFDRNTNLQISEIHVVKAMTGQKVATWKRSSYFVSALTFAPDGKMLAVAGQPRLIQLVNPAMGKEVGHFEISDGPFYALAFSPDGRTLAAGGYAYGAPHKTWWCELATLSVRWTFHGHQNSVDQLAFSPDGQMLATGGNDTTVLLWDLAGKLQPKVDGAKWTDKDRQRIWASLSDPDSRKAYEAMLQLYAAPVAGVGLLKEQVKPAPLPALTEEQIVQLIRDLDNDKFAVRDKAHKALAEVGPGAAELLRKALADKPSQEKKKRLETLLAMAEQRKLTPELLQGLRAIEALECIASGEARQILANVASGLPASRLTQQARAALNRLEKLTP